MEIGSSTSTAYFPRPSVGAADNLDNDEQSKSFAATQATDQNSKIDPNEEKSLIEEIREKGFSAYVEEMKEERKKEMREQILREMGLNEEALQKMSPEVRAQIEKMIEAEVRKRMNAENELKKAQEGLEAGANGQSGVDGVEIEGAMLAQIDEAGVGIGPLLALQEQDARESGEQPPSLFESRAEREKDTG